MRLLGVALLAAAAAAHTVDVAAPWKEPGGAAEEPRYLVVVKALEQMNGFRTALAECVALARISNRTLVAPSVRNSHVQYPGAGGAVSIGEYYDMDRLRSVNPRIVEWADVAAAGLRAEAIHTFGPDCKSAAAVRQSMPGMALAWDGRVECVAATDQRVPVDRRARAFFEPLAEQQVVVLYEYIRVNYFKLPARAEAEIVSQIVYRSVYDAEAERFRRERLPGPYLAVQWRTETHIFPENIAYCAVRLVDAIRRELPEGWSVLLATDLRPLHDPNITSESQPRPAPGPRLTALNVIKDAGLPIVEYDNESHYGDAGARGIVVQKLAIQADRFLTCVVEGGCGGCAQHISLFARHIVDERRAVGRESVVEW